MLTCDACDLEFIAKYKRRIPFCSPKCRVWRGRNPTGKRHIKATTRKPKVYSAKTRAKYRENHRKELAAKVTQWRKNNPEKLAVHRANARAKRRARMRNYQGTINKITDAELANRLAEYNGICAYCAVNSHEEWDHYIPLAENGDHSIENLFPSCVSCNRGRGGKHDRLPIFEWI